MTETPEVTRALDEAAEAWPEDANNKSALYAHLISEGEQALRRARRRRVLREEPSFAYPEGYLEELREDWPA